MQPIKSGTGFIYYGEREGWLIAATQAPDWGDALQRSNFRVMRDHLGESDNVAVEYAGGAVGHIDYLLVRPGTPEAALAEQLNAKIADYPVLDDDDLSELEWSEEWCVRCDMGTREDHASDTFQAAHPCKFRSRDDADEIRYRWENRHAA